MVLRVFGGLFLWVVMLAHPVLACDALGKGLGQAWPGQTVWDSSGFGARLIPESWYRALLRVDDGTPFAALASLERYGFRYCDGAAADPIGLVLDRDDARAPAVGLSCAGCHTGYLTDGKHSFVVQGGQGGLDLQAFAKDMYVSLLKLRSGPYKDAVKVKEWQDFSRAVLGADANAASTEALHDAVTAWLKSRKATMVFSPKSAAWGPGRFDAVQTSVNAVTASELAASASVSIPHLWFATQSARLQWTGSVLARKDLGFAGPITTGVAMRDIAEAIGAFAEAGPGHSSIRMESLVRLEQVLATLPPPRWPQEWGVPDVTSADWAAGEAIYDNACAACHARIERGKPGQILADATGRAMVADPFGNGVPFVRVVDALAMPGHAGPVVGTDPMRVCNALGGQAAVEQAALRVLMAAQAEGSVAKAVEEAEPVSNGVSAKATNGLTDLEAVRALCVTLSGDAIGYKAAPLAGIFATAPYLHNGSVPTLDDLLLPPDQRPARFAVGAVLFDPVKVGLGAAIDGAPVAEFQAATPKGLPIAGNANDGHAYPETPLTAVERAQLILYLKSL